MILFLYLIKYYQDTRIKTSQLKQCLNALKKYECRIDFYHVSLVYPSAFAPIPIYYGGIFFSILQ